MKPWELRLSRDNAMEQARRALASNAASPAVSRYWARFWVRRAREDNLELVKALRLAREQADLWYVHILGPGDVHCAPSREDAEAFCRKFNEREARMAAQHAGDDRWLRMVAVIKPWKGSAAEHAMYVRSDWKNLTGEDVGGP